MAERKNKEPSKGLGLWLSKAPPSASYREICEAYRNPEYDDPADWLNHGLDEFQEADQ